MKQIIMVILLTMGSINASSDLRAMGTKEFLDLGYKIRVIITEDQKIAKGQKNIEVNDDDCRMRIRSKGYKRILKRGSEFFIDELIGYKFRVNDIQDIRFIELMSSLNRQTPVSEMIEILNAACKGFIKTEIIDEIIYRDFFEEEMI